MVHTKKFLQFTDTRTNETIIPFIVHNDLDHAYVTIITYTGRVISTEYDTTADLNNRHSLIMALSATVKPRQSPRLVIQLSTAPFIDPQD